MKILMVLTSHDRLGDTNESTGFWLDEFAAPYYVFKDEGCHITVASPAGGHPPIDPKSDAPGTRTKATERLSSDNEAQELLAHTKRLQSLNPEDFDAIFYPGGHGPLWDLAEDINSISLIEGFAKRKKPIGCVCHGPAVLRHVKDSQGKPLVEGKKVTGFSNSEESLTQLTEVVPFMVQDMLQMNGGLYNRAEDWTCHIEVDGNLVTGQNPASSQAAAEAILKLLKR